MENKQQHDQSIFSISTIDEVARLLAVSAGIINHIVSRLGSYYRPRKRRKKDGSIRVLNVPNEELMLLQRKINAHILNHVPLRGHKFAPYMEAWHLMSGDGVRAKAREE